MTQGNRQKTGRWVLLFLVLPWLTGLTGCGCNQTQTGPRQAYQSVGVPSAVSPDAKTSESATPQLSRSAFPWLEKGLGPDGKPLNKDDAKNIRIPGEEFNRKYAEGLKLMEDEAKLGEALQLFEDIVKNFPGTEEASMAHYRIAQIHFRNKANNLALGVYKQIIQEYPSSPIAENARAAIQYLETFEKHEKAYVTPEEDDKTRRGW